MILALLFALFIPHPWIGDTFHPGQTITYAYRGKLPIGAVKIVLSNERGMELFTPGEIEGARKAKDLVFVCPAVKDGYYQIAEVESGARVQYGQLDGRSGFYVESIRSH